MEVQIAVAKVQKYAVSDSGDTVEVVERPQGGVSVVMADGQSSGRGAKSVSAMVVRKVISLIAEGVRDGAAARAASDALFTERKGKVSATLNIVSIDQQTQTMVITRNNPAPALVAMQDQVQTLHEPCHPIGFYRDTRPVITEISLTPDLVAVVFSDGLVHAGERTGEHMDVVAYFQTLLEEEVTPAQWIADSFLEHALRLDQHRPVDDISVVVVKVMKRVGDGVRRLTVRLPLNTC